MLVGRHELPRVKEIYCRPTTGLENSKMRNTFFACKQAQPIVSFPIGLLNRDKYISLSRRKDKLAAVIGGTGTGKSMKMRIPFCSCKQAQPVVGFPGRLNMDSYISLPRRKDNVVVVVIGATGTGKSKLSIDLASRFPAEIVNSDKIQVYKGLNTVTNKVTEEECNGVPHHLLGIIDPNTNFTAIDFRHHASLAVESIVRRGKLPIIAGGSNSFVKALVNDVDFRLRYDCIFLWVDVYVPVLHSFVSERVDRMVEMGLVNEVRDIFDPMADYTSGIRRAIGVPELDQFLRNESNVDEVTKVMLLNEAIEKIKSNTCKLATRQLEKLDKTLRLLSQLEWNVHVHRLDATQVFLNRGGGATVVDEAWEKLVVGPSTSIVDRFLYENDHRCSFKLNSQPNRLHHWDLPQPLPCGRGGHSLRANGAHLICPEP